MVCMSPQNISAAYRQQRKVGWGYCRPCCGKFVVCDRPVTCVGAATPPQLRSAQTKGA
jgi:hypothetical protein